MTKDKVREAIATYRAKFTELGVPDTRLPNRTSENDADCLAYYHTALRDLEAIMDGCDEDDTARSDVAFASMALASYRTTFGFLATPRKRLLPDAIPGTPAEFLGHCHAMLSDMNGFLAENRLDKLFRWIGFVDGCLWKHHIQIGAGWDPVGAARNMRMAFRLLGFIQGCLWTCGVYTVAQLKDHNRP